MIANGGMCVDRSHVDKRLAGQNLKNEVKKQKAADFLIQVFTGIGNRVSNDIKKQDIAQKIGDALGKGLYTYLNLTQWQPKDTSTIVDSVVHYISKQAHRNSYSINKISIQKLIDAHAESSRAAKNRLQKASLDDPTAIPELLSETTHLSLMKLYTKNHFKQESKELGHCIGDDMGDTFAYVCEKTQNGEMEVFAIRTKDPNIHKYPQGKPYWTIEYNTNICTINQVKSYNNDLLTRESKYYHEVTQLLGEIITQRQVSRNGISDLENITSTLPQNTFLTSRGELHIKDIAPTDIIVYGNTYIASGETSYLEIDSACAISGIDLDLTNLSEQYKNSITYISGSINDESSKSIYRKLREVGGYMVVGGLHSDDREKRLPALKKVKGVAGTEIGFIPSSKLGGGLETFDEEKYLSHAPKAAREYFKTLSMVDKLKLQEIIEYTADSINFTVDIGGKRMVIPFAKENIRHANIRTGTTEKVKTETITVNGEIVQETYFEWNYLNEEFLEKGTSHNGYTQTSVGIIPQGSIYESIIKAMPANDYTKNRSVAGRQLYGLLGGILSGYRSFGSSIGIGGYGCLWSASARDTSLACAVRSFSAEGRVGNWCRNNLFPVRAIRTSPYEA